MGGWKLWVGGWRLRVGGWRVRVGSLRLRDGGWSVRVGGYKLSVGGSRLMIEGWMFIGRGVRKDSLDGRVLDSSGSLELRGVSRWLEEVSSCVQGGLRRSGDAQSSRTVA